MRTRQLLPAVEGEEWGGYPRAVVADAGGVEQQITDLDGVPGLVELVEEEGWSRRVGLNGENRGMFSLPIEEMGTMVSVPIDRPAAGRGDSPAVLIPDPPASLVDQQGIDGV